MIKSSSQPFFVHLGGGQETTFYLMVAQSSNPAVSIEINNRKDSLCELPGLQYNTRPPPET